MENPQRRQHCEVGVCPSELQLDLLNMGSLDSEQAGLVAPKVENCDGCLARMELRKKGLAAFPEVDREALKRRLQRSLPANDTKGPPVMSMAIVVGLVCAAAAAVVLVPKEQSASDGIRSKGSSLRVYREHNGEVAEAIDGDTFLAGDRVRFSVKAAAKRQIMILGLEIPQKVSVYYPPPPQTGSRELKAPGLLPGAIRLNDFVGEEWLFLVDCSSAFSRDDVKLEKPSAPQVPDGCTLSKFRMLKK